MSSCVRIVLDPLVEFLLFRAATMGPTAMMTLQGIFSDARRLNIVSNGTSLHRNLFLLVVLIRVVGDEECRVSRGAGDTTRVLAKRRLAVGLRKQKARSICDIERVFGDYIPFRTIQW